MSLSRDRIDNISKALVGVSFDFEANQWMAKYGNTINIFPLPNKVASPTKRDNTNDTILSGVKVPNYPFEQAYIEASKWFLGMCASHRAKAAKEGNSQTGRNTTASPKKRRVSTSIDTRPQKKVAVEAPERNGDSVESPTPSEAKANFPVLSKEIGVKSVHSVSDYRVEQKEEQYLITGKIGSAGPLENWWIRLENVTGNQTAISKLKNYRKNYIYRNNAARRAEAQDLDGDEEEDEDQEYEVECLLDVRMVGKREEFLVKWKDYPPADNTWEPLANLTGVEPAELEQCRQKQAYLIVPRSNRSTNKDSENQNLEGASKEGQVEAAAHSEESGKATSSTTAVVETSIAVEEGEMQQPSTSANVEAQGEVVSSVDQADPTPAPSSPPPSAPVVGETVNSCDDEVEMADAAVEEAHVEGHGDEQIFLDVVIDAPVDHSALELSSAPSWLPAALHAMCTEAVTACFIGPSAASSPTAWFWVLVLLNLSSVFLWASTSPVDLSDDDSTPTLIARAAASPVTELPVRGAACLAVVACLSQYVTLLDGLVADGRWAPVYLGGIYSIGVIMIMFLKPSSAEDRWYIFRPFYEKKGCNVKSCLLLLAICFLWSILVGVVDPSRPRTVTSIDPFVDVAAPPPVLLLLGMVCAAAGALVRFPAPVFLTGFFASVPASSLSTIITNAITLGLFLLFKSVYDRHSLGPITLLLLRKLMGPFCNAMASLHGVCEDLHLLVKSSRSKRRIKVSAGVMLVHILTAVLFIGRDAELSELWAYSSRIYHLALDNVESIPYIVKNEGLATSFDSDAKIEKNPEAVVTAIKGVQVGAIANENGSASEGGRRVLIEKHDDLQMKNEDVK
ncbi:hypothetical protein FOL47_003456 [Perkinsus chesapeaki]|uniref:Chromo domain-containing protein n=1 Tax=Perkinsus chesapeaki TaxID=330153 RepID=A0A7J6M7U8_PERCH|nr:hypothetical protein FOL47_003456 [Perkinsus chesapeaki]